MVCASNPCMDAMNQRVADMLAELAAIEPALVARVAVLPPRPGAQSIRRSEPLVNRLDGLNPQHVEQPFDRVRWHRADRPAQMPRAEAVRHAGRPTPVAGAITPGQPTKRLRWV